LSLGKRMYLGRSAAGIGQPVGSGGDTGCPSLPGARQPTGTLRLRYDRTQQVPSRQFTLPDVRTDDEVRRLAGAQPPAQDPAVAPTDSPGTAPANTCFGLPRAYVAVEDHLDRPRRAARVVADDLASQAVVHVARDGYPGAAGDATIATAAHIRSSQAVNYPFTAASRRAPLPPFPDARVQLSDSKRHGESNEGALYNSQVHPGFRPRCPRKLAGGTLRPPKARVA
jgi:hypothetical protein